MSKLSSADVQLQQCEKCKQSGTHKVIGKLSFCAHCDLSRGDWTSGISFKTYGGSDSNKIS